METTSKTISLKLKTKAVLLVLAAVPPYNGNLSMLVNDILDKHVKKMEEAENKKEV